MSLQVVIERNVALVRSVSDQARTRIADAVFRGLNDRRPSREVAKEIREAVEMSRRRAKNIASDQLSKLTGQLNEERTRQSGIEEYKWVASGKVHFRENHRARDGKVFDWDNPPADGHPGQAIFCGCASRAYLDLDKILAEAAEAA
nr:phage minor head protein [Allopontixanthobacter sediminis]